MARQRGRGRRDPAKERFWRRAVRRWQKSGLSVREFCDWQALSEPCFYAWRRELAKRDRESVATRSPTAAYSAGRTPKQGRGKVSRLPAFLPIRVLADAAPQTANGESHADRIELCLPSGVRVWVPAGCDRQTLADVLAVLEAQPC
jgi:hypothetical protein